MSSRNPYASQNPNSLASDFGLYNPFTASSLSPPSSDPLALTPLRAHYLKRELVTLEFIAELQTLDSPGALSLLGPPFLPKSRFINGLPQPPPMEGSIEAEAERRGTEASTDLPFLRFVFNHFVLSFPFLANCQPSFFSHKLQPFVYSFVSRNISSTDEREEDTKRKKISGKAEKHLGLIMSAAVKITENGGREEVVRIDDRGVSSTGAPASQPQASQQASSSSLPAAFGNTAAKSQDFTINIVSVRNVVVRGTLRNKGHEEFIVRTRRAGMEDVFVARRYGDFTRLAETVSYLCIP